MAWRALRRSPGFTIAAVLLLAMGIGGATLIFSVTDAVLLRRLPVPHPEELARIVELIPGRPPVLRVDWDVFDEWKARTTTFTASFAHSELDIAMEDGAD